MSLETDRARIAEMREFLNRTITVGASRSQTLWLLDRLEKALAVVETARAYRSHVHDSANNRCMECETMDLVLAAYEGKEGA